MNGETPRLIAVFGSGRAPVASPAYEAGREVGRLVVEAGCGVLNGGYGGVMEASARGAREAGGQAIGILASRVRGTPNPYLTSRIEAHELLPRLAQLLERAEGYIWLEGGLGTLLELVACWHVGGTGRARPRPRVLLASGWAELMELMVSRLGLAAAERDPFVLARDPREAVRLATQPLTPGGLD